MWDREQQHPEKTISKSNSGANCKCEFLFIYLSCLEPRSKEKGWGLAQAEVSFYSAILCTSCVCTHTHTFSFSYHIPLLPAKSCNNSHFTQTINKSQHCSNILPELILITSLPLFYLLLPHWIWFPVLLQVFSQLLPPHWNLSRLLLENCFHSTPSSPNPLTLVYLCVCVCVYFCTYQFVKYFLIGFQLLLDYCSRHLIMYPSELEHCLANLMCSKKKKHLLNKWMKKS